jgi:hypothetical protein
MSLGAVETHLGASCCAFGIAMSVTIIKTAQIMRSVRAS